MPILGERRFWDLLQNILESEYGTHDYTTVDFK